MVLGTKIYLNKSCNTKKNVLNSKQKEITKEKKHLSKKNVYVES